MGARVDAELEACRDALRDLRATRVPAESLRLYGRWWALETWLRELTYIELRARFGNAWTAKVSAPAVGRRSRDEAFEYMASSDATNLLAYEDVGLLFRLIGSNWDLFKPSLIPSRVRWDARVEELLQIRHRVSHCRLVHPDDAARLEQTLRDLEPGAWIALSSYNHTGDVPKDLDDPVAEGWLRLGCEDARRLVAHAERQYETSFDLEYSVRPWARLSRDKPISGQAGIYWNVRFAMRGGRYLHPLRISEAWGEGELPECVVHVLADDPFQVRFTIAALEDPALVVETIGALFDGVLWCSTANSWPDDFDEGLKRWHAAVARLDHRVQSDTPLVFASRDMPRKGILFSASGLTE